jgi:Zn-dependent M28 family amino/carboxypeptidase
MASQNSSFGRFALLPLLLGSGLAHADDKAPPASAASLPPEIIADINPDALRDSLTALVGFGTRHTLSDTESATRGIGAARRWVAARFAAISHDCGGCLSVETPSTTVSGERIPKPAVITDVIAIQRGSSDPQRVIVITGHIDSRVSDVMNAGADAPGADDDGSGSTLVLEAARVLSRHHFAATIVYAVLSGEEQGLYGGKLLANHAHSQGWQIEADLNNDIVGATRGGNGVSDNTTVRLFSEGTRATETPDQARRRRSIGGELDSPSRNVARYAKSLIEQWLPNWTVKLIYRADRYSRGGDHLAFNEAGFPGVRFTESSEDYRHQHQDLRTENGVAYGDTLDRIDFPYLARVTATNAVAAAGMACAPAPPNQLTISGAVDTSTTLKWQAAAGASGYRIYWRDTTDAAWTHWRDVGNATQVTLQNIIVDDYYFGVASRSADGCESPVEFAGEPGAFLPVQEEHPHP